MGLFDRLKSGARGSTAMPQHRGMGIPATSPSADTRPPWMTDGMQVTLIEGYDDLEVVGESFYQHNLRELAGAGVGGRVWKEIHALLVAEHGNRYDTNAISVWVHGLKAGHLSREDAALLRPGLLALQKLHDQAIALAGVIAGGGRDDDGRARSLGVLLKYDRTEFGLAPKLPVARADDGGVRTGLSQALLTDVADDTYDLDWLNSLPGDPVKRLTQLRKLMDRETDPISRHYLFAELESSLYKFRDAFPTALEEYDSTCRQHDTEMDRILPALVEKFSVVPLLGTYRQAAIRHQKAKDYAEALRWAERGIALYGDKPAKQEMLADLQKRAASYRAKLA